MVISTDKSPRVARDCGQVENRAANFTHCLPTTGSFRLLPVLLRGSDVLRSLTQPTLGLSLARPAALPTPAPLRARHLVLVHADPVRDRIDGAPLDLEEEVDPDFARRLTPASELPDPMMWSTRFGQAALEIVAGRRGAGQMIRWTNRTVYAQLSGKTGSLPAKQARLRKMRLCVPADGVVEAAAIAQLDARIIAAAMRFEGLDGRWLCTALILG